MGKLKNEYIQLLQDKAEGRESRVFVLDSHKPIVNAEWLRKHDPSVIIKAIVGDNNIDLEYCKAHDIPVRQVDYRHATPCAEWCVRMLLHFAGLANSEVAGKRAVVVGGAGRIGSRLIDLLRVLRVRVAVQEVNDSKKRLGKLLKEADYCFVCCPLNESTRSLIGMLELASFGSKGILINVSRAEVCDLHEVAKFVNLGGRFALDSTALPAEKNGQQVFITPHISGYTKEANMRRASAISEELFSLGVDTGIVIK